MESTKKSRLRRWWVLAGIAISIVVAVTGVQVAAARAWKQAVAMAAVEEREWQQVDFRRPALWGETTPGSAFDGYERAATLIQEEPEIAKRVTLELRKRDADSAERDAALIRFEPALEALRAGAHAADARDAYDWSQGFNARTPSLLAYRNLASVAQAHVRQLADRGDDREAVRVMLDSAQCGRDLMGSPLLITQLMGCALLAISLDETAGRELLDRLSPAALTDLDRGLEVLDRKFPSVPVAPRAEAALLVRTCQTGAGDQVLSLGDLGWTGSWRYGFSNRLMLATAVDELAAFYDRCAKAAALPWPRAKPALESARQRVSESANPLTDPPNMAFIEQNRRQARTLLRLLRLDVAHRLGRELELQDPAGEGPLEVALEPGAVRFRSAAERDGRPLERVSPQ